MSSSVLVSDSVCEHFTSISALTLEFITFCTYDPTFAIASSVLNLFLAWQYVLKYSSIRLLWEKRELTHQQSKNHNVKLIITWSWWSGEKIPTHTEAMQRSTKTSAVTAHKDMGLSTCVIFSADGQGWYISWVRRWLDGLVWVDRLVLLGGVHLPTPLVLNVY